VLLPFDELLVAELPELPDEPPPPPPQAASKAVASTATASNLNLENRISCLVKVLREAAPANMPPPDTGAPTLAASGLVDLKIRKSLSIRLQKTIARN
jgi:hypothetical protein